MQQDASRTSLYVGELFNGVVMDTYAAKCVSHLRYINVPG